jgi:CRISPR/Cas system-associated endoribonuclease Cas2
MTLYVISYDVRSTNHEYQPLYDQLNSWGAAHLQNSVWLADLTDTAGSVREILKAHMHKDDTVCVIQIFTNSKWSTWNARTTGTDWLYSHVDDPR